MLRRDRRYVSPGPAIGSRDMARRGGTSYRSRWPMMQAVREQMRKLAVGGQASAQDEKTAIYEVSDSEDEDEDPEGR